MNIIFTKINSSKNFACVTDVGEIMSMSEWDIDDYSGYAQFNTSEGEFVATSKPNFVLCIGVVGINDGKEELPQYCSDPRVIMMYLWKLRQRIFNEPITDPPVPTHEEAIAWLTEMDIPIGPQATPREWTPKLERNFLNIKQ